MLKIASNVLTMLIVGTVMLIWDALTKPCVPEDE